jgi:hypothetical protein
MHSEPVMAKTVFTSTLDMQANLGDRLNRIHFLVDFLGLNGVLTKVSECNSSATGLESQAVVLALLEISTHPSG